MALSTQSVDNLDTSNGEYELIDPSPPTLSAQPIAVDDTPSDDVVHQLQQLQLKVDQIVSLKTEIDREMARLKLVCKERRSKPRIVVLNKVDGLAGFGRLGISVASITPDGPADVRGGLKIGDQLVAVNDMPVGLMSTEKIDQLIKSDANSVKMLVRYNPERLKELDEDFKEDQSMICDDFRNVHNLDDDLKSYVNQANAKIERLQKQCEQNYYTEAIEWKNATDGLRTVEVEKTDGDVDFYAIGTSIDEIVKGTSTDIEGKLKVGDELIEVNGVNVEMLSYEAINDLLDSDRDRVKLVVRYNPERLRDLEDRIGPENDEKNTEDASTEKADCEKEESKKMGKNVKNNSIYKADGAKPECDCQGYVVGSLFLCLIFYLFYVLLTVFF